MLCDSQTGTAQEIAERIGREAKGRYLSAGVLALDYYNVVCLSSDDCSFAKIYMLFTRREVRIGKNCA